MAISTVAATKIEAGTGVSASASVSATAGNALIVPCGVFIGTGSSSVSVAVTRTGDTYTNDTVSTGGTAGFTQTSIASAPNVAGGAVSMTITAGTGANGVTAFACEVSGLPTSAIRDASSPAAASASSTSAATNALTNVTAAAIYFAAVTTNASGNPITMTSTGSGWSDTIGATSLAEKNDNTVQDLGAAWLIVASTASRTQTWTLTTGQWFANIAVYKGSAVAARQQALTLLGVGV